MDQKKILGSLIKSALSKEPFDWGGISPFDVYSAVADVEPMVAQYSPRYQKMKRLKGSLMGLLGQSQKAGLKDFRPYQPRY